MTEATESAQPRTRPRAYGPAAPPSPAARRAEWLIRGAQRAGAAVLLALPAGLTVYLAFNAGGFFPQTVAVVALLLVLALAARLIAAERPFAGFSRPLAVAAAALALYAGWVLLSATWSHASWRALTEFDRALLYLLALLLFGLVPRHPARTRWMVRCLACAIVAVCVISLVSRLLPHVWPTEPGFSASRLSYPITYWNSVGLFGAIGLILALHLTSSRAEPPAIRVAAAAAAPVLSTTIYLTLSRGGIAAAAIGLVAYVAAGRPRSLVSSLLACVPASAVAVVFAYDANLLTSDHPTSAAAVTQGHRVAIAVVLCAGGAALVRAALIAFAWRIPRPKVSPQAQRAIAGFAAGLALALAIGGAIAVHLPPFLSRQYDEFVHGTHTATGQARLTSASGSGRVHLWKVAVNDGFDPSKLHGSGAGTFELLWDQHRPRKWSVPAVDGHSLYAETLGELGIVGLMLIVTAVGAVLFGFAARLRGPNRTVYAALFAAGLAWAVRAGVDWDWEMPVVTLWFFALGGTALAGRARSPRRSSTAEPLRRPLSPLLRPATVAVCLGLGVVPLLIFISQLRLDAATRAYLGRNDCRAAIADARGSTSAVSAQPEPYAIQGYCEATQGSPRKAIADMREAVGRDPQNWLYRYDLAIARAVAGRNPHSAVRAAARLNPREPIVYGLYSFLNTGDPRKWRAAGRLLARNPVL